MLQVNLVGLKLDKSKTLRNNSQRYTTKLGDVGQQCCVCLRGTERQKYRNTYQEMREKSPGCF